ncbi:MAG: nitroreductase family protein [Pseudomonadota bacterium]
MSPLAIDRDKCKRDAVCTAVCPLGLIEMRTAESYPSWIEAAENLCINCGHCVCACPAAALTVTRMTPEECSQASKALLPSYGQVDHFLRTRRSIRNYKDQPVDREILTSLLKTASFAPSGHNSQPVHWLAVDTADEIRRLAALVIEWMREAIEKEPEIAQPLHFDRVTAAWERGQDRVLRGAPNLVIAHADASLRASQAACIIALAHLELAAVARGLGTCWAGYFAAAANSYGPLMDALALPVRHQVFGALMIGHRKYQYARVPRRHEPRVTWR